MILDVGELRIGYVEDDVLDVRLDISVRPIVDVVEQKHCVLRHCNDRR